jgi:hypothetical protein
MEFLIREIAPSFLVLSVAAAILVVIFVVEDRFKKRAKQRNKEGKCARCGASLSEQEAGPIQPFGFYAMSAQGCKKCRAIGKIQQIILAILVFCIGAVFFGAMWWLNQ